MQGCAIAQPCLLLHVLWCLLFGSNEASRSDCMSLSCMNSLDILESHTPELVLALLLNARPRSVATTLRTRTQNYVILK